MLHLRTAKIRNVGTNALLNVTKTLLLVAFPLITFPYISRVLQVDNLGKINYARSIVSYFGLLAALGIGTYAMREGAKLRNQKEKLIAFANEIFSFNLITTAVAYMALFIVACSVAKLQQYTLLLLIESGTIIFTTLGMDWINVIYEDYLYITLRSLLLQSIVLVCLFIFVHTPQDYIIYAIITVATNGFISLLNLHHARQYCPVKITFHIQLRRHIGPILILFSNTLAVSVYLNIDTTMLGWMVGAYYVGLYVVAVKIYAIIKQLIASMYNVLVARMSLYHAENRLDEFKHLLNAVLNMVILFSIPATVGLLLTSTEVICLISGENYVLAATALRILAFAFFFAIVGGILANCVNLPLRREKFNLLATSVSAAMNIVLNIWLIPLFKQNGAAFTTLLSEVAVSIILLYTIRNYYYLFDFKSMQVNAVKSLLSVSPMLVIGWLLKYVWEVRGLKYLCLLIPLAMVSYFALNWLLKNPWLDFLYRRAVSRFVQKILSFKHQGECTL